MGYGESDWLRDLYFPENNKRLLEAHNATKDALDAIGLPYLDRPSGLYIYVDFREVSEAEDLFCNVWFCLPSAN